MRGRSCCTRTVLVRSRFPISASRTESSHFPLTLLSTAATRFNSLRTPSMGSPKSLQVVSTVSSPWQQYWIPSCSNTSRVDGRWRTIAPIVCFALIIFFTPAQTKNLISGGQGLKSQFKFLSAKPDSCRMRHSLRMVVEGKFRASSIFAIQPLLRRPSIGVHREGEDVGLRAMAAKSRHPLRML